MLYCVFIKVNGIVMSNVNCKLVEREKALELSNKVKRKMKFYLLRKFNLSMIMKRIRINEREKEEVQAQLFEDIKKRLLSYGIPLKISSMFDMSDVCTTGDYQIEKRKLDDKIRASVADYKSSLHTKSNIFNRAIDLGSEDEGKSYSQISVNNPVASSSRKVGFNKSVINSLGALNEELPVANSVFDSSKSKIPMKSGFAEFGTEIIAVRSQSDDPPVVNSSFNNEIAKETPVVNSTDKTCLDVTISTPLKSSRFGFTLSDKETPVAITKPALSELNKSAINPLEKLKEEFPVANSVFDLSKSKVPIKSGFANSKTESVRVQSYWNDPPVVELLPYLFSSNESVTLDPVAKLLSQFSNIRERAFY